MGGPYLLCLHPKKVSEILAELHDRVCVAIMSGDAHWHTEQ